MNSTIALVVLDMAGTTVQDTGQVPDAFAAALASFDVHVTATEITRVRGASKRQAIRDLLAARGIPLHLCDEVYEAFRVNLEQCYSHSAQPIRGARDTIRWLRQQGIRVALNTGFDRPTTVALLRSLDWTRGVADAVVCGDDVAQGRPSAEMILRCMEIIGIRDAALVANVGDTVLDLRAGHRAGVRYNVGVLSGAHRREVLEAEPHTHVIATVAELPSLIAPA